MVPTRLRQFARGIASPRSWRRAVELERLRCADRYRPVETRLLGPTIHAPDGPALYSAYRAIFETQSYAFTTETDEPVIIDGGANIGLSVIYFKQLFPASHVVAFEPDPEIAEYCRRNLAAFGIDDVVLHVEALWTENGEQTFWPEGADGGRIGHANDQGRTIVVKSRRLRDVLGAMRDPIDLLKLDIEGAESRVLEDCRDVLDHVKRVFVEYHSFPDRPQELASVVGLLSAAGFRLHAVPENYALQPFVARPTIGGMDLQLNIYAFREEAVSS